MSYTGTCKCGKAKISIDKDVAAFAQGYCHCDSCKKYHAAPVVPVIIFQASYLESGKIKYSKEECTHYESAQGLKRVFCKTCGGPVINLVEGMKLVSTFPGSILADFPFKPTFHNWYSKRNISIRDGITKWTDFPAEWGGQGPQMEEIPSPKILVFGATGNNGYGAVKALSKKGVPVRAAYNKSADKLKTLPHVEAVELNIYNPDSVKAALKGIERVFLVIAGGHTLSLLPLIPLFKEAGIKQIVKLSALGSEEKDPKAFIWAAQHVQVEEEIKKAGIPLVSLRPSSFFPNIFGFASTVKSQNTIYSVTGETPLNWVSTDDVGEAAANILTSNGHEGKEYYLTGPENITIGQLAKQWSDVLGREIKVVKIDEAALKTSARTFLPNEQLVDEFANMYDYFVKGGYNKKFDDLERLIGRKPTPIKTYFEETKGAF